jgi:hypothetical protein
VFDAEACILGLIEQAEQGAELCANGISRIEPGKGAPAAGAQRSLDQPTGGGGIGKVTQGAFPDARSECVNDANPGSSPEWRNP